MSDTGEKPPTSEAVASSNERAPAEVLRAALDAKFVTSADLVTTTWDGALSLCLTSATDFPAAAAPEQASQHHYGETITIYRRDTQTATTGLVRLGEPGSHRIVVSRDTNIYGDGVTSIFSPDGNTVNREQRLEQAPSYYDDPLHSSPKTTYLPDEQMPPEVVAEIESWINNATAKDSKTVVNTLLTRERITRYSPTDTGYRYAQDLAIMAVNNSLKG